jgi:hypothetical protein
MAPKKANSKADEATKAALLAARKGKGLALTQSTHQEATEDNTLRQLRALRLKNRNLQRQKEILEAKRQRVSALAKVRQMIHDEEQKARTSSSRSH